MSVESKIMRVRRDNLRLAALLCAALGAQPALADCFDDTSRAMSGYFESIYEAMGRPRPTAEVVESVYRAATEDLPRFTSLLPQQATVSWAPVAGGMNIGIACPVEDDVQHLVIRWEPS